MTFQQLRLTAGVNSGTVKTMGIVFVIVEDFIAGEICLTHRMLPIHSTPKPKKIAAHYGQVISGMTSNNDHKYKQDSAFCLAGNFRLSSTTQNNLPKPTPAMGVPVVSFRRKELGPSATKPPPARGVREPTVDILPGLKAGDSYGAQGWH